MILFNYSALCANMEHLLKTLIVYMYHRCRWRKHEKSINCEIPFTIHSFLTFSFSWRHAGKCVNAAFVFWRWHIQRIKKMTAKRKKKKVNILYFTTLRLASDSVLSCEINPERYFSLPIKLKFPNYIWNYCKWTQ